MHEEHWVSLDGFEGYSISNYGRVYDDQTETEVEPYLDHEGYWRVILFRHNAVGQHVLVHRLVARCFFLNYSRDTDVRHISKYRNDNSVLNLTLTPKEKSDGREKWD